MYVIETIRKRFAIIGADSNQSTTRMYPFNVKNSVVLLMFVIDLIINDGYFFYGAVSFQEYVNSSFDCSTCFIGTMVFAIIIWKMVKIIIFLKNLSKIIEKRKY